MSLLFRLFTAVDKYQKSLDEDFDLKEYIQPHALSVKLELYPFRYAVIDDFFKPEFFEKISQYHQSLLSQGVSDNVKDTHKFHRFDEKIDYDGYVFSPRPTTQEPLKLFFSLKWNIFFSKLFHKPTTFGTNFALHHHTPKDRTGWVHHDYATYIFPHKLVLSNGVTATVGEEESYPEDPKVYKLFFKQKRTIAIIYYLNNPEWKDGDGGETGLYSSKDKKSLVKKIAPVNNRLLVFDVSPASFHAFQENLKERNSVVQWFHADLDWCEKKYGFL